MQNDSTISDNQSPTHTKKPWYDKKWVVILWLIFFYPVGVIGLWLSSSFKQATKIIVTCLMLVITIATFNNDGQPQKAPTNTTAVINSTQKPINVDYKIISDESKRNIKRTVEIELGERTDKETLKAIAQRVKSFESGSYERTFIAYRVKGDNGSSYWATTHYNPNLEVNILGTTKEEYDAIKKSQTAIPTEKIIGSWLAHWGVDYKMVAYINNGTTYIKSIYSDGENEKVYQSTPSERGLILQDEGGKERGEYFLINSNGDLEFWSQNGNFYTAKRHKN